MQLVEGSKEENSLNAEGGIQISKRTPYEIKIMAPIQPYPQ